MNHHLNNSEAVHSVQAKSHGGLANLMDNDGETEYERYLLVEYERAAYSFGPSEAGKRNFEASFAGEAGLSGPILGAPVNKDWWEL